MVTLGVALCGPAFHTYCELPGEVNIGEQSEQKTEISFCSFEEFRSPGALEIFVLGFTFLVFGVMGRDVCVINL